MDTPYARPPGGSIANAFQAPPITIPLVSEPQGEAISFDPNGHGYYTTSEGSGQPIYYFDRLPSPPGAMYWDADGVAAGSRTATGAGTGGSGTWNASARRWYNGSAAVPWAAGDDAIFWGTAGTVTLAAGQTANSLAFKTDGFILAGSTLTLAGSSVTVDSGVNATISSTITGAAGLAKNGSGLLAITQANSYSGGTTITGGTLLVINATGSGTGAGQVTVNMGAQLGGTGTVQGDVINSGTLAPGNLAGTFHVGGTYTESTSGRLDIELVSVATYDKLQVSGTASLAGTLAVTLVDGFSPTAGNAFEIVTAAGFGGGMFTNTVLPTLSSDLSWIVNYGVNSVSLSVALAGDFNGDGAVDTADYVVWRKGLETTYMQSDYDLWRPHFGQSTGSAVAAPVPEPNCLVLALLGIVATHVRRRTTSGKTDRIVRPTASVRSACHSSTYQTVSVPRTLGFPPLSGYHTNCDGLPAGVVAVGLSAQRGCSNSIPP